jgi:hypothetical protein
MVCLRIGRKRSSIGRANYANSRNLDRSKNQRKRSEPPAASQMRETVYCRLNFQILPVNSARFITILSLARSISCNPPSIESRDKRLLWKW